MWQDKNHAGKLLEETGVALDDGGFADKMCVRARIRIISGKKSRIEDELSTF